MTRLYSVAGVSTLPNGQMKTRVATDLAFREKQLTKAKHTDIRLIELGTELSKKDAMLAIKELPKFSDAPAQAAIDAVLNKIAANEALEARRAAKATKAVTFTPDVTKGVDITFTPDASTDLVPG